MKKLSNKQETKNFKSTCKGWLKATKRNLIGVGSVVLILITLAIVVATMALKNKPKVAFSTITPELARAMEYEELKDEEIVVDETEGNVEFGAFFLRDITGDGYTERLKGTCKEIGRTDTLYMEIKVKTGGKLTKGKIEIQGTNFELQTALPEDELLKTSYIGNDIKVIEFKDLLSGTQKLLDGVVRSSIRSNTTKDYSRDDNKIVFTGTYVDEAEQEHEITKEIPLTIDWYGKTKASIYSTNQTYKNLSDRIDEEKGIIKLNFSINSSETQGQLNLKTNHVEGTIPLLEEYEPQSVRLVSSTSNVEFDYSEDTKKFTIDRKAIKGEDGTITPTVSNNNTYEIEVTYPIDAYHEIGADTVTIEIPVKTYYEGFNNDSGNFINPYKSNTAETTIVVNYSNPRGEIADIYITVGKYFYSPTGRYMLSKQKPLKIYNEQSSEEKDDTYIVRWEASSGTVVEDKKLTLREVQSDGQQVIDQFIKTNSNRESMDEVTTNIGIYFYNANNFLKEDGWIRVYDDETGNLIGEFSKDNWSKYTESKPYKYETPVKHIRVETSEVKSENSLYVYNVKELNDEAITTKYNREAFDNLEYIESTLTGYLEGERISTKTNQAKYEAPYSIATISISKNTFSTQITEENVKITINADYNQSLNQIGWVNGSFLVKIPNEIVKIDIKGVEIDNSQVEILNSELIENEEGRFIKIITNNKTDQQQVYDITIKADITPDPRIATISKKIELYASNEKECDYYYKDIDKYDVNGNLNKEEKVNKTNTNIYLVSPNNLLVNQTLSGFDNKGTEIVSPQIAEVKPNYATVESEIKEVKIGVQLRNNYSSSISEIKLLGRIPSKGNKYVINGRSLESDFSTTMKETGIEIPSQLENKVKVYYSDNLNADNDVKKLENNWKEKELIKDWESIKSFLIDFEEEILEQKAEYVFYYTVKLPEERYINEESYSHFGVYFAIGTEKGKYKTNTEPNKIGIRIADKYDLELEKYQKDRENLIKGATYLVKEILENDEVGETKAATTNELGILEIENLYAEKTYEIKEIRTSNDYELNEDVIRFIGHVNKETGNLTVEKIKGTTRDNKDIEVTQGNKNKFKIKLEVEDKVKVKLKIIKQEKNAENKISEAIFNITGEGLPKSGKNIRTNSLGEVEISGLRIDQEYTLQETKAKGYYLLSPIKFKIIDENQQYKLVKIDGEILANQLEEKDGIPTLTLTLENEKIPRYSLEVYKIKRITETTLSTDQLMAKAEANLSGDEVELLKGAKFKLYKGTEEIGTYETKEDGKITIEDLYLYVDGKDEEATYTLKEVLSPVGYAKVKDITFKAEIVEGELKLINIDGTEEDYTTEGNSKIKLLIQDSPSFKLIKKDAEEQTPLANIKFAIYNIDEGEELARNSKGEIIGNKETINGKEYYTVKTNNQGEITEDLPEGLYKAVEVEAPDKYDLSNATYYFGIGASREGKKALSAEWGKVIGCKDSSRVTQVIKTRDGGYIVVGYFNGTIELGENVEKITSNNSQDGMVIKYNSEGNAQWGKAIGGDDTDEIFYVNESIDGDYVLIGSFESDSINLGESVGEITNNSSRSGMIIKLNNDGQVELGKAIGGEDYSEIDSVVATKDGNYILKGYNIGIIKYNNLLEEQWKKEKIGEINSIVETTEGGYIVVGGFYDENIDLGDRAGTITSNGSKDGMIIKYDSDGNVQWGKAIGGIGDEEISSVIETSDGGYIIGGDFESKEIDLGTTGKLIGNNTGYYDSDGMIIKLNSKGEIQWGKAIGGEDRDIIISLLETEDEGFIVLGRSSSKNIDLGESAGKIIHYDRYNNTIYFDLIIKLKNNGNIEWGKEIEIDDINSIVKTNDKGYVIASSRNGGDGGNGIDPYEGVITKLNNEGEIELNEVFHIDTTSIAETEDGGFIIGGNLCVSSAVLGGNVGTIYNMSSESDWFGVKPSNGVIAKYNKLESPKVVIKEGRAINCSVSCTKNTKDGGFIIVGELNSKSIDLGTAGILENEGNDKVIIKFDNNGQAEWGKIIKNSSDQTFEITETKDESYILNNSEKAIKYKNNGEIEWEKDNMDYLIATKDGGLLVYSDYNSDEIIKYNADEQIEWRTMINKSDRLL